ncbi:hypothetical protein OPV22_023684 [Ensete ventricosum]|uniref:Protein EXORDIUM n=1 Tax=Ensete ventricosum TaxID=4639 RepID=A0AAV8QTH4_ENSVE|nr:hypothetical protein OPV22_023684 [Ensete ventricosum]
MLASSLRLAFPHPPYFNAFIHEPRCYFGTIKTPTSDRLLLVALLFRCSYGGRTLAALVEQQPLAMTYHRGALITGNDSVNLVFYGKFTASQRAIISDFVASLSPLPRQKHSLEPSVATWWTSLAKYYATSKTPLPKPVLGKQILDETCSLGKLLRDADLAKLAARGAARDTISVVLTAEDVAVDRFCMSRCGSHGSSSLSEAGSRFAYIWVGNSAAQCPGQCAWPFHQPMYGPQTPPLVAPNGDVGADGMVINLASMLAGATTNPFGDGFFQGPREAPLEAATACPGVYAKGAYPGYPGDLLVDPATRASYNAHGAHGRKYLVPALFDPSTSACSTLV